MMDGKYIFYLSKKVDIPLTGNPSRLLMSQLGIRYSLQYITYSNLYNVTDEEYLVHA